MRFDVGRPGEVGISEVDRYSDGIDIDPDKLAMPNDVGLSCNAEVRVYDSDKLAVSNGDTAAIHSNEIDEGAIRHDLMDGENEVSLEPRYIYLHTRNESLEGDCHPITGVPFEKKAVRLANGDVVEGVFPVFNSFFDATIKPELYKSDNRTQFKECNLQLYDAIENDPDIRARFTPEQIEQIKEGIDDGSAPDGYVWHHSEELGVIQLVDYETHERTGHTGGKSMHGGGYHGGRGEEWL